MESNKKIDSKKISEVYKKCSEIAAQFYEVNKDKDVPRITYLKRRFNDNYNRYQGSWYTEEGYVMMMLSANALWKFLCLSRFGVEWYKFNSPTEVLGFSALSFLWIPEFIMVNKKDPTNKYEIDLSIRDMYGNNILLVDIQSKSHENQPWWDYKKKDYFEKKGIPFVQVTGSNLINRYDECVVEFSKLLEKSLAKENVSFLCSHPNYSKHETCFKDHRD